LHSEYSHLEKIRKDEWLVKSHRLTMAFSFCFSSTYQLKRIIAFITDQGTRRRPIDRESKNETLDY
jgi:hypothetical protein